MSHKVFAALAAAGALVAPLASHAGTLNFDFSFEGGGIEGDVGLVTGEIFGLTDNATSTPSDVVIFSAPAAMGALPSSPWDLYAIPGHQFGDSGLSDNFTVTDGAVTATNFGLFAAGPTGAGILDLGYGGVDFLANIAPGAPVGAFTVSAPSAAVFTLAASTGGGVPEPEVWALMISGFFGLGSALRRSRRAVPA